MSKNIIGAFLIFLSITGFAGVSLGSYSCKLEGYQGNRLISTDEKIVDYQRFLHVSSDEINEFVVAVGIREEELFAIMYARDPSEIAFKPTTFRTKGPFIEIEQTLLSSTFKLHCKVK